MFPVNNTKVIVAGGACAALSLALLLVHAAGWTPLPVAVPLVAIPAAIALRSLLVIAGRSASASRRRQVLLIVSSVGLAVSAGAFALALPPLLQRGGTGTFVANVVGASWTIGLLTLVCGLTRTLPLRAAAGAFFTGFFGVTALAALAGTQAQRALGADSALSVAVLTPITEELLKALPVLIFVLVAERNRVRRPSVGDVLLVGAVVGAGFMLYEDLLFGRSGARWGAVPPFTLLVPSMSTTRGGGLSVLNSGHIVLTALVAFGLGFGLLYRRRFDWAIWTIPVTLVVAILAHMTSNQLVLTGRQSAAVWAQVTTAVTLKGYLVPILLLAGLGWTTFFETRLLRSDAAATGTTRAWYRVFLIPPTEAARRAQALATAQTRLPVPPRSPSPFQPIAEAAVVPRGAS